MAHCVHRFCNVILIDEWSVATRVIWGNCKWQHVPCRPAHSICHILRCFYCLY